MKHAIVRGNIYKQNIAVRIKWLIFKKIIENDKGEIRKLEKMADKVMSYEDEMTALTDEKNCKQKRLDLRNVMLMVKLLDQLCLKHLQLSAEEAKRVLGLFPYKGSVMGGVLHHGDIRRSTLQGKEKPNSD